MSDDVDKRYAFAISDAVDDLNRYLADAVRNRGLRIELELSQMAYPGGHSVPFVSVQVLKPIIGLDAEGE